MTRLFLASTQFGALTLAAALDEGLFGGRDERRVLLTWSLSPAAEAAPGLHELPGFAGLAGRFDAIVSLNDLVAPLHPAAWRPPAAELPMLERLLRHRLEITDPISDLVVESLGAATSATLAAIFRGCPVTVYSDGLMSYGPTRTALPHEFSGRIERLLHLDLVPGLRPMLLREFGVKAHAVGDSSFVQVAGTLPPSTTPVPAGAAMIVGQYLSALDLLGAEEEDALHVGMLRALVAGGHRDVVFKPHPAAGRTHRRAMAAAAEALDVALTLADERDPVEALFRDHPPSLVVGCFSTALAVAQRFYGIPVATMGTEAVLRRLRPYENSNRIPATIAHASYPQLQADGTVVAGDPDDLTPLVEAVGFCMQPKRYPELLPGATCYVDDHPAAPYFEAARLAKAGIVPQSLRARTYSKAAALAGSKARSAYVEVARLNRDALLDRYRRPRP